MSDKLHIYACSGIGDVQDKVAEWISDDTKAQNNTQAMNTLLTYVNSAALDVKYCNKANTGEYRNALNNLDFYSVCFYYARLFRKDEVKLGLVGECIAKYTEQGGFDSINTEPDWHEQHVDKIIDDIDAILLDHEEVEPDNKFVKWWMDNVVRKNVVGLNEAAVGKTDYGDLNEYLYNAGTYFLYLYIPEDKIKKLPYHIRKKIRKQSEVYDYCKKCFCPEYGGIYGSEEDLQRIIYDGIRKDFSGATPDQVIDNILAGKQTVGSPTVIAAIISAVATIIVAILGLVINYASSVAVAKYTVPEDPESGMATEEDLDDFGNFSLGSIDWSVVAVVAGVGLLLYYGLND